MSEHARANSQFIMSDDDRSHSTAALERKLPGKYLSGHVSTHDHFTSSLPRLTSGAFEMKRPEPGVRQDFEHGPFMTRTAHTTPSL